MAALILLLLLLAALVGGFVAFEGFQSEIRGSNQRVPAATKRVLAPSRDALSTPQLVLMVFDRASLIARTDPGRRAISFLSIPGDAHLRARGGTTVAGVLGTAGPAGLVRFARSALGLQIDHIELFRTHDVAPLVDAVGGIKTSSFGGFVPAGRPAVLDGAAAQRYIGRPGPSASRTRRERAVMDAITLRLSSATSLLTLRRFEGTFSAPVATDLSPRDALALALVRLSSKLSIQCGLPEGSTLEQARSRVILRQFEGARPTPRKQGHIFPANGCRAARLSLHDPAAVISVGKQALALVPFAPEVAGVAIALDVMLLLALLGVPRALSGMVRSGRIGGRRLRLDDARRIGGRRLRLDDAKSEPLSSAPVSERLLARVGAYTLQSNQSPVAAPAKIDVERPADEIHESERPADEAIEEQAAATRSRMEPVLPKPRRRVTPRSMSFVGKPSLRHLEKPIATAGRQLRRVRPRSVSFVRKPSLRHLEKSIAAAGRQLRYHGFRAHPDRAWVLGATPIAIFLGYLIAHL